MLALVIRKRKQEAATMLVRIRPSDLQELKKWSKAYGEPVSLVLHDAIEHYAGKTYKTP